MVLSRRRSLRRCIAWLMAFILILCGYSTPFILGITTAFASEKIELPKCVPDDAEKKDKHTKKLDEYDNEYTIAFENEDGSKTFYIYQSPIRYKDEQGNYQLIDNSIVEASEDEKRSGYFYKNKSNDFEVLLPDDIVTDKGAKLEFDDKYSIEFKPNVDKKADSGKEDFALDDKYKSKEKDSKKYSGEIESVQYYSGFNDDIEIKYTPTSSGIKEEIVINKYTGQNAFEFEIKVKGVVPEMCDDGYMLFKDTETGEVKALIEPFFAKDSYTGDLVEGDGHYTENITSTITATKKDTYILTVTVDKEFLESEEVVYPVVVDPSVNIYRSSHYDSYVSERYSGSNYSSSSSNRVGYTSTYHELYSYIKFDLSALYNLDPYGIVSAEYKAEELSDYTSSCYIRAYRVTGSWSSTSINWSDKPGYTDMQDEELVDNAETYSFDIENAVSGWLKYQYDKNETGAFPNYGIVLRQRTFHQYYYRKFGSANSAYYGPVLEIQYDSTDTVAPNNVSSLGLSASGVAGSNKCKLTFTWNGTTDNPSFHNVGVERYHLYLSTDGGTTYNYVGNKTHAGTGTHTFTLDNMDDNCNYKAGIRARDINLNYSGYTYSSLIFAGDYHSPSAPTSVTVTPGSWTNQKTDVNIDWTGINPNGGSISAIRYSVDGSTYTLNSTAGTGDEDVSLASLSNDGEYMISVWAVDDNGNTGSATSDSYYLDTTDPDISITAPSDNAVIGDSVAINGIIDEDHSPSWTLSYKKVGDSSYTNLTSGTSEENGLLYTWNTQNLAEGNYFIKLSASDGASNTTADTLGDGEDVIITLVKSQNSISTGPGLQIASPEDEATIIQNTLNVIYERTDDTTDNLSNGELYIDGYLVDLDDSDGLSEDLTNISKYEEGSQHYMFVKAQDDNASGEIKYTTTHYDTAFWNSFLTDDDVSLSGTVYDSNNDIIMLVNSGGYVDGGTVTSSWTNNGVTGYINEVTLTADETTPMNTDIEYQISIDNGVTWYGDDAGEIVELGQAVEFEEPGNQLVIKAVLRTTDGANTPELESWQADVVHVAQGQEFTVQLVGVPSNVSAKAEVNYMTLIRWNDTVNEAGTTYNVYRGTTSDFVPSLENQIASDLTEKFYYDSDLFTSPTTLYYKVTAEKNLGTIMYPIIRESLPSTPVSETPVDVDELDKRLGLQDYWKYTGFRTGGGTGYIELSQGNLCYQSVDSVYPSQLFAFVMRRSYNSLATSTTPMGDGWDFSFNTCLLTEYDSNGEEIAKILKDGDGSLHRFVLNTGGTYDAPKGVFMTLSEEMDGTWEIKRKDNITYIFDKNLKLYRFTEPNGNYLEFTYDDRGNLTEVESNTGDSLTLSYYVDNYMIQNDNQWVDLLTSITDPAGRVFTYAYNDYSKELKKRTQIILGDTDYIETYDYDASGKLSEILDGENSIKTAGQLSYDIAYYTSGDYANQVSGVTYPNADSFDVTYTSGETTVTDNNGNDTEFTYNTNGCVTQITDADLNSISYSYNSAYQVTQMSYSNYVNGSSSTQTISYSYDYDSDGNIETITDPYGNDTEYQNYNSFNKPAKVIVPIDSTTDAETDYTYDTKGNVLTVTDPEDRTTTYTYYSSGLIHTVTDCYNNTTTYTYNTEGRLTQIDMPLGVTTKVLAYDELGNPTITEDAEGNQTKYEYDDLGRLVKTYLPDEVQETTQNWTNNNYLTASYDMNHNLVSMTDAEGFVTQYDYDAIDRLIETTAVISGGDDIESTVTYGTHTYETDTCDKVTYTDPEGLTTIKYYNAIGRLIKVEGGGSSVYYEYDKIGNVTKVWDDTGAVNEAEYDKLNRRTQTTTDPTGLDIIKNYTYDLMGNVLTVQTAGVGDVTKYEYDLIGRMEYVQQNYDSGSGTYLHVTQYTYDGTVTEGSNTYIVNTVTDAEGGLRKTYLDGLGRVYKETDEGYITTDSVRMVTTNVFNDNGQVTQSTYNDNSTVDYDYDGRGQLTLITYDTNDYTEFEYDDNGRQVLMTATRNENETNEMIVSTSWAYDSMGRVSSYTQDGNTVRYEYLDNGALSAIKFDKDVGTGAANTAERYLYDTNGRLQYIYYDDNLTDQSNGDMVRQYIYNATTGELDSMKTYRSNLFSTNDGSTNIGSGYMQTDYTYNNAGMITEIEYLEQGTTQKELYEYTYDDRGYIETESLTTNYGTLEETDKTYTYDVIGRLTHEGIGDPSDWDSETTYTYDKVGNRLTKDDGSDVFAYIYDSTDDDPTNETLKQFGRLMQIDKNDDIMSSYEYDTVGRTTKESQWQEISSTLTEVYRTTYTYNDPGELYHVQMDDHPVGSGVEDEYYYYNGSGQRIRKIYGSQIIKTYYSGSAQLVTMDGNNIKLTENILSPGGNVIASKRFDDDNDSNTYNAYENKWYFYNYDVRGSVTAILSPTGAKEEDYSYDPFGITENGGSNFANDMQFTGAVSDQNTGLYYMNARYYNPNTGRFLTQDSYSGNPYDPWTQHLYSYCGNNPTNYVDPTGHIAEATAGGGGGVFFYKFWYMGVKNEDECNVVTIPVKNAELMQICTRRFFKNYGIPYDETTSCPYSERGMHEGHAASDWNVVLIDANTGEKTDSYIESPQLWCCASCDSIILIDNVLFNPGKGPMGYCTEYIPTRDLIWVLDTVEAPMNDMYGDGSINVIKLATFLETLPSTDLLSHWIWSDTSTSLGNPEEVFTHVDPPPWRNINENQ